MGSLKRLFSDIAYGLPLFVNALSTTAHEGFGHHVHVIINLHPKPPHTTIQCVEMIASSAFGPANRSVATMAIAMAPSQSVLLIKVLFGKGGPIRAP